MSMDQLSKVAKDVLHKNGLQIDESYNIQIGIERWSPNQTDDCALIVKMVENANLTFRLGVRIERRETDHPKQVKRCSKHGCAFTTTSTNDLAAHYYLHFFDGDSFIHNCCENSCFSNFQDFCTHYNEKHKDIKSVQLSFQECDSQIGESLHFEVKLKKVEFKSIIKDAFTFGINFEKHFDMHWNSYDFIHRLLHQIAKGLDRLESQLLNLAIVGETRRALIRRSARKTEAMEEIVSPIARLNIINDDLMTQQQKIDELDCRFRGNVTDIVGTLTNPSTNSNNEPRFIIGGSIVEGAAICRYFQPKVDGGHETKNPEVEVDINLVAGSIPSEMKSLVQEIPGKHLNIRIKSNDELLLLLTDEHKSYSKSDSEFLKSYYIKEAASRTITFARDELWLRGLVALAKSKDTDQISFSTYGEYVKPTAATDVMVKVNGNDYVNVSLDISVMFKIGWGPPILNEWIERKRVWPSKKQIEDLLDHSFIISKPSNEEKDNYDTEEFSFSFHHLEARLAILRSDEQRLIYSMSKSLVYRYIKPLDIDIPSFYPKTVMLWTQEKYAPDHRLWKDPFMAIKYLLHELKLGIENEKLQYYFVPKFNIVKRLEQIVKDKVVNRLRDLVLNTEDRLKALPVEECLRFYSAIVEDCDKVKEILDLKPSMYHNYPRIHEDQFLALRNELEVGVCYAGSHVGNASSTFVGRQNELAEIHRVMSSKESTRAVIIHGLGGYGKTELARQYLNRFWGKSTNKYWIDAESELAIKSGISGILNTFNPSDDDESGTKDVDDIIRQAFCILRKENAIMVFDNVVNPQQFCSWVMESRQPTGSNLCILGTSQLSTFNKSYFQLIPVPLLSKETTSTFLKDQLDNYQYDKVSANTFCNLIGCHPLSLRVSISYIKKNDITLNEFNKQVQDNDDIIMYKLFPPEYGKALYSTLNITIQNVVQSENTTMIDLMCISALLDRQNLDKQLLLEYEDNENRVNALQELINRSLIFERDENFYDMHSLIRKVVQIHIERNNTLVKYIQHIIQLIKSVQETAVSRNHSSFGDLWLHHLLPLIQKYSENHTIMGLFEEVKDDIVAAFQNKGGHKDLMVYLNIYLKYETETCQHLDMKYWTIRDLGWSLKQLGEYDAALKVFRDLYDKCVEEYGNDGERTMKTKLNIAVCLKDLGNLEEARCKYDEVYATRLRDLGESHEDTMIVMGNLAICMDEQGQFEEAQCLYEKHIILCKSKLGDEHVATLKTIGNLASCLSAQGKLDGAIRLKREVYETQRKVLGIKHRDTLMSLHNLAIDLDTKGDLEDAKTLFTEAYEMRKKLMGDSHPLAIKSKKRLSDCIKKIDQSSFV